MAAKSFLDHVHQNNKTSKTSKNNDVKLYTTNVDFDFVMAQVSRGDYKMSFIINIFPKDGEKVTSRNVDKKELEKIAKSKLLEDSKKYFDITKLTTNKLEIKFDVEKWLKDAVKGVKPKVHYSRFDKEFKLKEKLPKVIVFNNPHLDFNELVAKKFKEWTLKHKRKTKDFFKTLFPHVSKTLQRKISNMFDWSYDNLENKVVANLKSVYVMGLAYAVGSYMNKKSKNKLSSNKRKNFEMSVKKNVKNIDRDKFEKFIKKNT